MITLEMSLPGSEWLKAIRLDPPAGIHKDPAKRRPVAYVIICEADDGKLYEVEFLPKITEDNERKLRCLITSIVMEPHSELVMNRLLRYADVRAILRSYCRSDWIEKIGSAEQAARGQIYFIQAESGGPVKIGTSTDPESRLSGLQVGSLENLRIIGKMNGGRSVEAEIHKRFARHHLRGEWFSDATDLMEFIGSVACLES